MQGIGKNRKNLPAGIKTEQKVKSQKKMKKGVDRRGKGWEYKQVASSDTAKPQKTASKKYQKSA